MTYGFRIQGLGFRVQGSGCRVQNEKLSPRLRIAARNVPCDALRCVKNVGSPTHTKVWGDGRCLDRRAKFDRRAKRENVVARPPNQEREPPSQWGEHRSTVVGDACHLHGVGASCLAVNTSIE